MAVSISPQARNYLLKKAGFYASRNRKPRLVLAERSCHGANFRIFFEAPELDDQECCVDDLCLYVPKALLEEYQGFDLDLEQFFFTSRIIVSPRRQSYACDCKMKCDKNEEL